MERDLLSVHSGNIAAEIQKEYGVIGFKDPRIRFENNLIIIRQHLRLSQIIYICLGLMSIIFVFTYFKFPLLYLLLFIALPVAGIIYEYSAHFNVKEIDFNKRELRIRNRLPFVELLKRMLNRMSAVSFHDISHFMTDESRDVIGLPRTRILKERRTELKVKFFDHAPWIMGSFRFERDARRFGELLQFHIKGKAKFNE